MGATMASVRVNLARTFAQHLLGDLESRWRHTVGVAVRAEELGPAVPPEGREALVVAAWLHDIGYAAEVARTGFHPLDGAAYLDAHGWPRRIVALVAHHSGSDFLADVDGFAMELAAYPHEQSAVSDALTYADQTVGQVGQRMSVDSRIADALARHGPESTQARVQHLRRPYLLAVAHRVEQRLAAASASNAATRSPATIADAETSNATTSNAADRTESTITNSTSNHR